MKLENEIQQKKFRNEYHKLAVNLIFTHGWFVNLQARLLSDYDLTLAQFNILRILRGQHPNPASINLLKERMLDKMSDVSRLVERMQKKELVIRKICPDDRRKAEVIISPKGLNLLSELDEHDEDIDNFFKNITSNEAKIFNELCDKLRG